MSDIAIRVEGLGKQYHIGRKKENYKTLADTLTDSFISPFRRAGKLLRGHPTGAAELDETFWALENVSFEVKRGDVLGIVGRNGAGKSTLLKILSRITDPTTGFADINGRVASLLEVGTGFHPELTGRENIYLNGAILGMRREEIERKFEEIVDFAEIEKFIDTPVKHYSSGMYVRLAFAVAAHLEPEILLVDEVLAVGDVAFQTKCLGKMGNVAKQGRTVLFVSHNMGAIENLCTSGIWIDQGKMLSRGDVAYTISSYIKSNIVNNNNGSKHWKRSGTGEACITDVRILDSNGNHRDTFRMGETIVIEFEIGFYRSFEAIDLALQVKKANTGISVLHLVNQDSGFLLERVQPGKRTFRVEIPNCILYPTLYEIWIWVGTRTIKLDYVENILSFSIVQSGISRRTTRFHAHLGIFHLSSTWK